MDTFWGSGSVEGRAASFLLNFLVGQCRITQCQGRVVQRGGCREELFVSTISDALGRYWQEEDDERTRGQNKKGEIFWLYKYYNIIYIIEYSGCICICLCLFVFKGERIEALVGDWVQFPIFAGPQHRICLHRVEEKKKGEAPLFVFDHLCLFV